ncbi:MAG: tRNA (guanosine(37)-N1)-methyltransferase TrmD [Candidatus Obscuribacterales bacterium]|nr:tRNA (guanosine(37)-N1)-methyltransferase TrmD [Candidatus Obscuribacterales bacterium]
MLNFHIITLFPELINTYCSVSIIGRGISHGEITVKTYNPRDFCSDKYRKVDDTPYGGGAGMVLKPEPFFAAFESIQRASQSPVILTSPQGKPFKQDLAWSLTEETDITILCGHYEGFDERICSLATMEVSTGDYVLTGGELPALTIIDAVGRLVPGVIGKSISLAHETFVDGLLEGPQYTKPPLFREMEVPEILRSGDHQKINQWRREQALKRTFALRPDLLAEANLSDKDRKYLADLSRQNKSNQD